LFRAHNNALITMTLSPSSFTVIPSTRVEIPSLDDLARPDYLDWHLRRVRQNAIRQLQEEYPPDEAQRWISSINRLESIVTDMPYRIETHNIPPNVTVVQSVAES
jgi:hypothetical protein